MRKLRKWTKREEMILLDSLGAIGVKALIKKLKRTRNAIDSKIRRLLGPSGLTQGTYTLRAISEFTGYDTRMLKRARNALGQKWKRTSPKGRYLITEDQFSEIKDWLVGGYWSNKAHLYRCIWCGIKEEAHHSRGLCKKCHDKYAYFLGKYGISPWDISSIRHLFTENNTPKKYLRNLEKGLAVSKEAIDEWN